MRRRIHIKIKHKLFATLFLTGVITALAMFWFLQWNFDRGFLKYVNSQDVERLEAVADLLADEYAGHGNWEFLSGNHRYWQSLFRRFRPEDRSPGPPGDRFHFSDQRMNPLGRLPGVSPPPPEDPRGFAPRITLFDAAKQVVIGGRGSRADQVRLQPIISDDVVAGYVGLAPVKKLSDTGDLHFVEQQTETFALVALVMLGLSLVISLPITAHLLRPVHDLTAGTIQLIAGRFSTRIPISTSDELGILSRHFNTLALTLEENEKARKNWVADISHELRTPLAVLQGEVEAIQDGVRTPEPKVINALHSEITHLGRLVSDLYELSMTEIGALNYKMVEVNPVGILQGTLEAFEPRFEQKGITIRTELSQNMLHSLVADPDRLQQLFANLLENSLRYTSSPGALLVTANQGRDSVVISFSDTAPGVEDQRLDKLFDRLYRGDESRNRDTGGAGLGLAICRNIVDAHQGGIKTGHSSLGGLLVTIELPLNI